MGAYYDQLVADRVRLRQKFFPTAMMIDLSPAARSRGAVEPEVVQAVLPPPDMETPDEVPEPAEVPVLGEADCARVGLPNDYVGLSAMEVLESIGQMLAEKVAPTVKRRPAEEIIRETAREYGWTVQEVKGHRRTKGLVVCRHVAMWRIAIARPDLSLPAIGRLFGGRDHTTVLHALRRRDAWLQENLTEAEVVDEVLRWGTVTESEALLLARKGTGNRRQVAAARR